MGSGKRYNNERKLNVKKVFGVIIAVIVIIMIIISIQKVLEPKTEEEMKISQKYYTAYKDGKWGVINDLGTEIIPCEYEEMLIVPDSSKDVFIRTIDENVETGEYKTVVINKKSEMYDVLEKVCKNGTTLS